MRTISLEELLEAGCHFGHQVTRQNPKARDFVFEARENIHIIDLEKTKEGLEEAGVFIKSIAQKEGSSVIIVGTKRQAKQIVEAEAKRGIQSLGENSGISFVTNRWIGGILTNFSEVIKNFKKLKDFTERLQDQEQQVGYTKREVGQWAKERQKLESFYGGISAMTSMPSAMVIIDTHLEHLAVSEARKMGIPIVGIVDTNADPFVIDHPIPANDDAVGSVQLITAYIVDAWVEGKSKAIEQKEELKKAEEKVKDENVAEPEAKKPTEKTKEKKASSSKTKAPAVIADSEKIEDTKKTVPVKRPASPEQATARLDPTRLASRGRGRPKKEKQAEVKKEEAVLVE